MKLRDEINDRQQTESHINDPEFLDYRHQINSILDSSPSEEYVSSQFTVYKNQEQQYRCHHTLQTAIGEQEKKTLLEHDFEYTEHFRKGMLEPSISDFSRRTPINSTKLIPTPNQTPEQIAQGTKSNVNLFGKNNNMLSVNNIDTSQAVQIQQQAQMSQSGPTLSLTMKGTGGFANILILAGLVAGFCTTVFLITLSLIK